MALDSVSKPLVLCLDEETAAILYFQHEKGRINLPAGPISILVPIRYHEFISEAVLRSVVCTSVEEAEKLRDGVIPDSMPIISQAYTETVYDHVQSNLKPIGVKAIEEIHPWILNILIDNDNFDEIICTDPSRVTTQPVGSSSAGSNEPSTSQHNSAAKPSAQLAGSSSAGSNEPSTSQHNSAAKPSAQLAGSSSAGSNEPSTSQHNSASAAEPTHRWSRPAVLKLIDLYQTNEHKFKKVGIKKKMVWRGIAESLTETDSSWTFTAIQCEQKWKNLTKNYRDTVDNNNKSGATRKESPFYKEMEDCYGYKPNVRPQYTAGSQKGEEDPGTGEDTKDENPPDTAETETESSTSSGPSGPKRKKTTQDILTFLGEIQKEFKEEHEVIINHLKDQHKDRMEVEERKMNIMTELVKSMKKN